MVKVTMVLHWLREWQTPAVGHIPHLESTTSANRCTAVADHKVSVRITYSALDQCDTFIPVAII